MPALLLATDAAAVRQPEYLAERPVETAQGRGRLHATTSWTTPASALKAWTKFVDRHGAWQAIWDQDRGTPLRVFGEGLPASGTNDNAELALLFARKTLVEQLELLAPGSRADDFALVANVVHGKGGAMRTVAFAQTSQGLPVLGGNVSFLFKQDRLIVMGSTASPRFLLRNPVRFADPAVVRSRAIAWIEAAYGATPRVLEVRDRAILPIVRESADHQPAATHHVVTTVVLDLAEPRARWEVYVDAESGAPLARRQLLKFGTGTLNYSVPARYPAGDRPSYPARNATVTVDGAAVTTGADGEFTSAGTVAATVVASTTGPRVRILNGAGAVASQTFTIADGASETWDGRSLATFDSQLTGFVHANLAKSFALAEINPNLAWLTRQISVGVNESGNCNAYSTGDDIHFYVAGGQCENTGRLADVIYHEFGHSLHAQSVIDGVGAFDSHLSEGTSDYVAASMTDDPAMGRGFFVGSTDALRHIDPTGREYKYPRDMSEDPHASGLIIAGALWDTRKALITEYGAEEGKRKADDFFYAVLQRASDIPSTYVEVLAADDDDGNLRNGTPNKCLIDRAFSPHGLLDPSIGLGIETPTRDNFNVAIAIGPPAGDCPAIPVQSVVLRWKLRSEVGSQIVAMTVDAGDAHTWRGAIPPQADGSVVQYLVSITLANGQLLSYPDNAADPQYEFYVGPSVPVYCTDFASDPFAAGWTHSASRGTNDWQWGAPSGNGGDPSQATSGTGAVGTDLGTGGRDGAYSSNTTATLLSPMIDVAGKTGLRLRYRRWLGVEDGMFDQATVLADGQPIWSNFASTDEKTATVAHRDREWRTHSIDLTSAAADGTVQIGFRIASDAGLEFGGWTIDDFCILATSTASCGDQTVDAGETCDDGNTTSGDGCSAECQDEDGEIDVEDAGGCCSAGGDAPAGPLGLGLMTLAVILRRRRRA